ncbi:MAG TPA: dienelactone hydrolase family protein [Acidobacteriaceae bacterium]|nr:dienelactone hydrolase family protein [Acidobacteriaceae bacterium]
MRISPRSPAAALVVFLAGIAQIPAQTSPPPQAVQYVERELMIPWVLAAPGGLDALLVYADLPGRHPLAVLTHGSSRDTEEHAEVTPWQELPQALWFARRGWIALVVVRRGYGRSGGEQDTRHAGRCPQTNYQDAAEYGAEDLRIALDYGRALPNVDPDRAIAVGVSTGGLATVALTAQKPSPPGLVAAISFAGGRGSHADHDVCNPGDLVSAFRSFGKTSRVPMLWIYAQNDKFFWPELAQEFDQAFRSQGGNDQFVLAPPFGNDGHALFHRPSAWGATVDSFLAAQNLMPLAQPLPEIQAPDIPPPPGLSEDGRSAFSRYLLLGPYKAFAMSEHCYGFSTGQIDEDQARHKALESCRHSAQKHEPCSVVFVNNAAIH